MTQLLTRCLIVINIYPLQLQFTVTLITASGVDSVFITDHLPKLKCTKCLTNGCWIAYIMSIHIRYSMMQQFSHLSPAQSHCRPSPHPFRSDAIKHKHLKDFLAIYSKAIRKTLSILHFTIKMEDTASTSTKPYVMYIILPWHRSGCRTVRPEDARFPSLCCCM